MPGKSPTQRIEELAKKVQELETAFEKHRAVADLQLQRLEARDGEHTRTEDELRNKVSELTAKNAALEERARHQEKTTDRGWQLWLAALGFGFGLISLLITVALQLKK
ncbi:hypothetical protein J8F10_19535 [Gemmata sp. G18]|uniref:DUF1640 domain-containing protein n=1 Tax=Gemmata palustris TaxID=2822762 RepID=A0ABS5BUQ8_9BACT|nr:hypothetical protein [Gemmata palustris]MBP3957445.1 hypothetical protein [Gemmata palustris]